MKKILIYLSAMTLFVVGLVSQSAEMVAMAYAPGSVIVAADADRAVYDRLRSWLDDNFGKLDYIITATDLRLQQMLLESQNVYEFDPYENRNVGAPLQQQLSRNDLFCITHIAVNVTKQNTEATPSEYGNYPLFTFPDPEFFSGTGEAKALETIFNGKLSFSTSALTRLESFLLHNCRYVPERTSEQEGEGPLIYQQYGPTAEARGYCRLNPNLLIDGQEDNKFTIRLGSGTFEGIEGDGDPNNVIVLMAKGFRVSGIAPGEARAVQNNANKLFS